MEPNYISLWIFLILFFFGFLSSSTSFAVGAFVTITFIFVNSFIDALLAENPVTVFAHYGRLWFGSYDIAIITVIAKRADQDICSSSSNISKLESRAIFCILLLKLLLFFNPHEIDLWRYGLLFSIFTSLYLFFFLRKELGEDLLLLHKIRLIVFKIVGFLVLVLVLIIDFLVLLLFYGLMKSFLLLFKSLFC